MLIGILTANFSANAQLSEVSLDEKIQQSSLIVEGWVVAQESYKAPDGEVYTANKVAISALLKGKPKENFVTVTTWGGETEEEAVTWSHMLTLLPGDEGVFFLERSHAPETSNRDYPAPAFDVYSSSQGFLKFARNDIGVIVAHEPFHTYTNLKDEVYDCVAGKTGQTRTVVDASRSVLHRSGIRYFFKTLSISGTTINFEILVNSIYDNELLYKAGAAVNYNTDCFGSNIATNGNLSLQTNGISTNSAYTLSKSNLTSSKAKIEMVTTGSVFSLSTLTTSEQTLAKASLTIQNPFADPGVSFDIAEMYALSKYWESGASYEFDTVIVETDFNFGHFAPVIDSIRPLSLRAGTDKGDTLYIYGKNFGSTQGDSKVFFADASVGYNQNNRVRPLPKDYIWSDNLIKVTVPTAGYHADTLTITYYAGSGPIWVKVGSSTVPSSENITVRLAAINRHRNDNGGSIPRRKIVRLGGSYSEEAGYNLYYTQEFKDLAGAVDAFERALCTWVDSSHVNFRVKEFSAIPTWLQNNACKIDLTDDLGAGISSTVKAHTPKIYSLTACAVGDSVMLYPLRKFDILFRKSENWYLNEAYDPNFNWNGHPDLQSLALHELGHAQQLLHVNQQNDVMYWEVFGPKRKLKPGDKEGGVYMNEISTVYGPNDCIDPMASLSNCITTPTSEIPQSTNLEYFPNPTFDYLNISLNSGNGSASINLIDQFGRIRHHENSEEGLLIIDMSKFQAGFYLLNVIYQNGTSYSYKIMKI